MKKTAFALLVVGIGVAVAAGLKAGAQDDRDHKFHFMRHSLVLSRSVCVGTADTVVIGETLPLGFQSSSATIPYFLFHFVRSKGRRTWGEARNLFYDYFVTPLVAFLPRQLVEQWSGTCGVRVVQYDENPGLNIHSFLCLKENDEQSHLHSGSTAESHGSALLNRDIL